jgi:hypothetical protein
LAFCPYCGKEVSPRAVSCPNCGHPLAQAPPTPKLAERISRWWWLLPFFLGWVGGLVDYLVLKDRNQKTAEHMLFFGVIWTFVGTILWGVAIAGFAFGLFGTLSATSNVTVTTLTCTYGTAATSTCMVQLENTGNAPATVVACSLGGAASTLTGAPLSIPAGEIDSATCIGAPGDTAPGQPVQGTFTLTNGVVVSFSGAYS